MIPIHLFVFSGRFQLHPRCMAVGTKARPYTPCSADSSEYDSSCEPDDPGFDVNKFDAAKAKRQSYEYLIQKPLASGEMLVATRGKQMAIAIGYVCHLPMGFPPFFLLIFMLIFEIALRHNQLRFGGSRHGHAP